MANYFSNRYPYTDIHELNLDWIIRRMRELEIDMDEFKVVNNITFSGQWDITKQYPAWTIVSDNNRGYVSIQPVPVGVVLTNSDYWVEVIDYTAQIAGLQQRVVDLEQKTTDLETADIAIKKAEYTVINVREYGADNTGIEDNTTLINNLIANNYGCTFYFEPGTYLFNSGIIINQSCKIILSPKAILKANDNISTFITLASDGSIEEYASVFGMKKIEISGGIIDCNNNADVAIENEYTYHATIDGVKIINFTDIGIHLIPGGGCCNILNTVLFGKDNNANYGIKDDGADNYINRTSVVNCNVGFRTVNDKLVECTAWIDERGVYNTACAFENRSRSTYTSCIADTVKVAWRGIGNSTTILANCEVINNDGVVIPTSDTLIFDNTDDVQVKYEFINLTILLAAYTFASNNTRISGINIEGTSGVNMPALSKFSQIPITRSGNVNYDAAAVNATTNIGTITTYFLANAAGNATAGSGALTVYGAGIYRIQVANIENNVSKHRVSTNSGATWSAWV